MKKHALIALFIFLFSNLATAQLTLKKMESNRKISLPIDALIEIKLPTKTSRPDCDCFQSYKGYLKSVEDSIVNLVLIETNRETADDSKSDIREKHIITQPKTPIMTRVPLSKVLAINRYSETTANLQQVGGIFLILSILSNLFLAPQISGEGGNIVKNVGYGTMAFGAATFLLPTKKTFYFEQPKKDKNKKTLWKLGN
jgi:hypothetical protein